MFLLQTRSADTALGVHPRPVCGYPAGPITRACTPCTHAGTAVVDAHRRPEESTKQLLGFPFYRCRNSHPRDKVTHPGLHCKVGMQSRRYTGCQLLCWNILEHTGVCTQAMFSLLRLPLLPLCSDQQTLQSQSQQPRDGWPRYPDSPECGIEHAGEALTATLMKGSQRKLFSDELRLFISTTRKLNMQMRKGLIIHHPKLTDLNLALIPGSQCTEMGARRACAARGPWGGGERGSPSEAHMFFIWESPIYGNEMFILSPHTAGLETPACPKNSPSPDLPVGLPLSGFQPGHRN